jgi:hypothetical protein
MMLFLATASIVSVGAGDAVDIGITRIIPNSLRIKKIQVLTVMRLSELTRKPVK